MKRLIFVIVILTSLSVLSSAGAHAQNIGFIRCTESKHVGIFAASNFAKLVTTLKCGEKVVVIEEEGVAVKVRSSKGIEGFVLASHLSSNRKTQQQASSEFPLTLTVRQVEQVPYTVEIGGTDVNTSCRITGSVSSTSTFTTSGNITTGDTTSSPALRMDCQTKTVPPLQWQHVLSAMLVEGSNGVDYIIACDAAWRWSKCRPLRPGDTYQARLLVGEMMVQYLANGKTNTAKYKVLNFKPVK